MIGRGRLGDGPAGVFRLSTDGALRWFVEGGGGVLAVGADDGRIVAAGFSEGSIGTVRVWNEAGQLSMEDEIPATAHLGVLPTDLYGAAIGVPGIALVATARDGGRRGALALFEGG